jgi:hypothetical protein
VERTHAGLAAARARGRKGGRPPVLSGEKLVAARGLYDSKEYTVAPPRGRWACLGRRCTGTSGAHPFRLRQSRSPRVGKTDRNDPPRWFSKEDAARRWQWRRRQRHRARRLAEEGGDDQWALAGADERRTGGRLTW